MKWIFQLFFSKSFEDKFHAELDKVLAEKDSAEEYIRELTENYVTIIKSITPDYQKITIDRTDFKKIRIDDKIYDLDLCISHNQTELYEHLCAIDALFADALSFGIDDETCCRQIEDRLN